jgi:protein-S-isoprenylcysteine O-methyltransferase Ste14
MTDPLRRRIDLPPLWLLAFALAAWGQARLLPLDPGALPRAAGWLMVAAGLGLLLAAAVAFARARTTIIPHREPSALVTGGVYRISRNPIYLGDLLILAGLCLIWGAVSGLVLVPLLWLVLDRRFVRPEAARLRARFGPAFDAWAARTRAWI